MKKKIVLWGNDAEDKKILVALELIDAENKVKIYTYPEAAATEEVYTTAMNKWRDDEKAELLEGYAVQERPLSMTDDLLPEDIKVERTDIIARAKAEWHFIVLSSKLYEMYSSELDDYKEKVDNMSEYSEKMWEEMKGFWGKVQEQVRDKNLFREHAGTLREKTNGLFDRLKELKKSFQDGFKKESAEKAAKFKTELDEIEAKIEKGLGLKPLFDQLKNLQNRFKDERFTKDDQRKLWNKIDLAFKNVKEKRFGDKGQNNANNGALDRVQRRYNGLLNAIGKMEKSIKRDRSDLDWEQKKIDQTDGQLEMQIRQAKIKMIEERVSSKGVKLDDMLKTKLELEKKIESEKVRAEKSAEKEKAKEVAQSVKEKIAKDIQDAKEARADDAEKLESLAKNMKKSPVQKAAAVNELLDSTPPSEPAQTAAEEAIKEEPKQEEAKRETEETPVEKESLFAAATAQIGDALSNVVDTVKAVAEVVEDKIEDKFDDVKEAAQTFKEEKLDPTMEDVKENAEKMVSDAKEAAQNIKEKAEQTVQSAKEEVKETSADEKLQEVKESVGGILTGAFGALKDIADKIEDKVEEIVGDIKGEEE